MAVVAFVAAIARRVIDVIGHFIAGVGHEILSFFVVASADPIKGEACCKGSSKGCQCDSLRSLHG